MQAVDRLFSIGVSLLTIMCLVTTGCARRDFTNDPVKWSFVSGDGSWDSHLRKWTVHLSPGETSSAKMRLYNTSSQDLWVLVQFEAADGVISGHLDGPFVAPSGNILDVQALSSAEFTMSATANVGIAPPGPHRYVIDLSWSTNEPAPAK